MNDTYDGMNPSDNPYGATATPDDPNSDSTLTGQILAPETSDTRTVYVVIVDHEYCQPSAVGTYANVIDAQAFARSLKGSPCHVVRVELPKK